MSLTTDLRRLCEACEETVEGEEYTEEDSEESIVDVGESVRTGGGVLESGLRSGLKGEEDGEAKRMSFTEGKVKARGVGEMIVRVGASGASVAISRSEGLDCCWASEAGWGVGRLVKAKVSLKK